MSDARAVPGLRSLTEQWDNRALFRLLWPLVVEQVLAITIGLADTVMVARPMGEHAVSGVSLVDAINQLLIIAFGALATGGTVVVSQYIGRRKLHSARLASRQLIYASTVVSLGIMALALVLRRPILQLIYGQIAEDVMRAAEIYFFLSALSYPFLALYNAAAALYRSVGNSRVTMLVAVLVNILNIGGNALFIFGFHWGVTGVGLATLISRVVAAAVLIGLLLYSRSAAVSLSGLFHIRLQPVTIRSILKVGVPNGLESSMFQIGKLLVSRIFTTFGTAAIAANAITASITAFSFMPANAISLALLTIVGQCAGAADYTAAKKLTAKLMKLTYGSVFVLSVITIIFMDTLLGIFGLTQEAVTIAKQLLWIHCVMAPISWSISFSLPNALRASGDVRYCMVVATVSMWLVRVLTSYLLAYPLGFGPAGVWYAMVADWCVRGVCYASRWKSGKWQSKAVI
ncbi:MATE family efflux transporter [Spirochaetia bacterium]|nr:MATE family efflux transporter [Spirochaetia bacterium]